jgi:hypothetical protein
MFTAGDGLAPPLQTLAISDRVFNASTVPSANQYPRGSSPPKVSRSTLEIDVHISSILNRHLVKPRHLHHDFTEYLRNPTPQGKKLVHSVKELWEDEQRRRKDRGAPPDFTEPDPSQRKFAKGEGPEWAATSSSWKMIEELVDRDARALNAKKAKRPTFEDFVKPDPFDSQIRTTFERVDAIFPSTWEREEYEGYPFRVWASKGAAMGAETRTDENNMDVDMTLASQPHIDEHGLEPDAEMVDDEFSDDSSVASPDIVGRDGDEGLNEQGGETEASRRARLNEEEPPPSQSVPVTSATLASELQPAQSKPLFQGQQGDTMQHSIAAMAGWDDLEFVSFLVSPCKGPS